MDAFEHLVSEAIDALPPSAKKAMDNVAFFVEPEAREAGAHEVKIGKGQVLLGLYRGVSRLRRGANDSGALPDTITIFQRPIEMLAGGDPEKLRTLVFEVVHHEVGHHLGFDEPGIRALEARRRRAKPS